MKFAIDIFKPFVPYLVVAVVFFMVGMWVQSGRIPVTTEPITKYILRPDGYLDLPSYTFTPTMRWVVTERKSIVKDTVLLVDTVFVPAPWKNDYRLFSDNSVRAEGDKLYLTLFDPRSKQFQIDQYRLPEKLFRSEWVVYGGVEDPEWIFVNGDFTALRPVLGTRFSAAWKRIGVYTEIETIQLDEIPTIEVGFQYTLWRN